MEQPTPAQARPKGGHPATWLVHAFSGRRSESVTPAENDEELQVSKPTVEGSGQPRSARGRFVPRPSGPARDLRSARLGIKRLLRDRRAGRVTSKEFERRMGAYRALIKIALQALVAQPQEPKQTVIRVNTPAWLEESRGS
jgi:hypothetical protein